MAEINISNLGGGGGTLTLTTTGTGGASTYVAGVLNIPVYQSALTNPVTGTGTATRVAFWDTASSVSSSSDLYWDSSNNRLGVGNSSPGARLQVNGSGLTSGTTALSVKDSGGTDNLTVTDDGAVFVRGVLTVSGSSASNATTLMGRTVSGEVASISLGTNLSFSGNTLNATGGGTPAGSTGEVQFNNAGAFGASSNLFWDNTNSRLGIGTATLGARLQVNGSGATSATNAFLIYDSGSNINLNVRDNGDIYGRYRPTQQAFYVASSGYLYTDRINFITNNSWLELIGSAGFSVNNSSIYLGNRAGSTITQTSSGTASAITTTYNFAPSSGSTNFIVHNVLTSINQTGGANGITRGVYVNPTLTSAADWRSIEWSNSAGYGIYGAGSAPNYLAGKLSIGTTTANTSSIVDISSTTSGVLLPRMTTTQRGNITSPADGLTIYNTTSKTQDVYNNTRWLTGNAGLTGSATLDFGSTAAQTSSDLTITVTGAADGDVVSLGVPNASVNANTNYTAWVSAADTVTVRFNNYSSAAVDPASGTFKVFVTKFS